MIGRFGGETDNVRRSKGPKHKDAKVVGDVNFNWISFRRPDPKIFKQQS